MDSSEQIVEKYLREWFMEQDSLLIPDLGRLQTDYQGAAIQSAVHKLSPPNKTFRLDTSDKENDDVFAEYIALNENISEEEASVAIKQYITSLKIELGIQKRFKIANFGTFIHTPDGNIRFEVIEDYNYSGQSFGLPQIYAKPAHVSEPLSDTTIEQNDTTMYQSTTEEFATYNTASTHSLQEEGELLPEEDDDVRGSGKKRIIWYAVLVILLIAITLATTLMLGYDIFGGGESDNNNELVDNTTISEEDNLASPDIEEETENISEIDNNNNTETTIEEEPISSVTTNTPSIVPSFTYKPNEPGNLSQILVEGSSAQFFVILGSFDKAPNAYSFYNNLSSRGITNTRIIAPNANVSKYRVALAGLPSKVEARRKGNEFLNQYGIKFWILKY